MILNLLRSVFDTNNIDSKIKQLEMEQNSPDFFSNPGLVKEVGQKLKSLQKKKEDISSISLDIDDAYALIDMIEETNDNDFTLELEDLIKKLIAKVEEMKLQTLLRGKYDYNNAILTLHAGAGGTEAQDWTQMLYRMYTMFAEKNGFSHRVLDVLDGDDAGIKSITFMIEGENAYGYLKCEMGVHRLVRISPFDSNARRHTSFASLEVLPEIEESTDIEIKSEDLKVDTFRSSGAGGQHVNKTESAIRITHIPSGIVVSCQTERSQIQNRETAMKMLYSKLAQIKEQEELAKLNNLRGELKKIEWGSQIRSYVFQPYTMVKDHRTNFENTDITAVMNGDIKPFINEYLKKA